MPDDELIPTERVARIMYLLMRGHRYTTQEASVVVGLQVRGAREMLSKISRAVPLHPPSNTEDKRWAIMEDDEN
jgi:hypothetical protein